MNEERNVLSRWSQRKAAARRGEAPPEPVGETKPASRDLQEGAIESQNVPTAQAAAADDDMPVLPLVEELNSDSDYTVFLNAKVPEAIRRAALRKLWSSDPVLANLDGLNDYDEDYNLVTTAMGVVQSAWQAGRGYVDEVTKAEDKLTQLNKATTEISGEPAESPHHEVLSEDANDSGKQDNTSSAEASHASLAVATRGERVEDNDA